MSSRKGHSRPGPSEVERAQSTFRGPSATLISAMDHLGKSGPILIVADDKKTASLVALYLEREGFKTITAHDGERGLDLAKRHHPKFVILDLMLPKVDGWEREEEMDRVLGLSLGTDDYVVKPFSPRELTARVKAILRRVNPDSSNWTKIKGRTEKITI